MLLNVLLFNLIVTSSLQAHFAPDEYECRCVDEKRKLKFNALPTIFAHRPPKPKRKSPTPRIAKKVSAVPLDKAIDAEHSYSRPRSMIEVKVEVATEFSIEAGGLEPPDSN